MLLRKFCLSNNLPMYIRENTGSPWQKHAVAKCWGKFLKPDVLKLKY